MDLTALVLLALAAFRVTRFIIFDSLIDEPRDKFHIWLVTKKEGDFRKPRTSIWMSKIHDLFSCTWCVGVWVSVLLYWVYAREFDFINIAAVAGLQGLIHLLEPDDE